MFYNFATWFTCLSLITVNIPVMPQSKIAQMDESHIMTLSEIEEELVLVGSEETELNEFEQAVIDMQNDMDRIEDITCSNMDWYIAYKNVIEKYSKIIPTPATVYDFYTEDEIYLIQRAVETECFEADFDSKCNVASVIFNRIEDPEQRFGKNVEEVITTKNQFVYGRKIISDSTKLAVEYAFEILDTTNGCVGFRNGYKPSKFQGWNYAFTDQIGHHFYREEEKN